MAQKMFIRCYFSSPWNFLSIGIFLSNTDTTSSTATMPFSLESRPRPTKTYHFKPYDRISKHHGFDGQGKTILVTGGASGVGYAISKAFAEAGVPRIAIVSRSVDAQEKAKSELETAYPSVQILPYQASVTDNTRMTQILQELGPIDVLILNAAVAHRRAEATAITTEEMQEAFETNVIAPFNLSKAYLAHPMPASGRKTILNVSSAGVHLPGHFRVGYGSSKAAGVQVMQSFASQYKEDENVKIFSFHPGSFYTPGVAANMPKGAVEWEDVDLPAHFAVWLAGPDSGFLHGRYLWANWDVDELTEVKDRLESDATFLTVGLIQ